MYGEVLGTDRPTDNYAVSMNTEIKCSS